MTDKQWSDIEKRFGKIMDIYNNTLGGIKRQDKILDFLRSELEKAEKRGFKQGNKVKIKWLNQFKVDKKYIEKV